MKKILILLFALFISFNLFAEKPEKITEVGISSYNPFMQLSYYYYYYSNFSLNLKFGNTSSLTRISSISFNDELRNSDYLYVDETDTTYYDDLDVTINFGIAFGKEYRKLVAENFEFRYGADILFAIYHDRDVNENNTSQRTRETYSIQPGIRLMLGFNYVIKEKFIIGIEVLPSFIYTYSSSIYETSTLNYYDYTEGNSDGFSVDINDLVLFSFSYRF